MKGLSRLLRFMQKRTEVNEIYIEIGLDRKYQKERNCNIIKGRK